MLLDTHLLIWSAFAPERLGAQAFKLISATENPLHFSWASLWEIVVKTALGRASFSVDVGDLHDKLIRHGFKPLTITLPHLASLATLPMLHRDPFDRLLVAQAMAEGITLLTADRALKAYGRAVKLV